MISVRLDVVSVQLHFRSAAMLALCLVSTNNRVDPLVMRSAAILASRCWSVTRVVFSRVPEPALISTRLRAELHFLKGGDDLARKQLAAILAGLFSDPASPSRVVFTDPVLAIPTALALQRTELGYKPFRSIALKCRPALYTLVVHNAPFRTLLYYINGPKLQSEKC
jgi:hypothetical protein